MLDNKYIRKALDFTNIEGLGDCIIFEYVDGKSLSEHVRVGTLSEKQVKSILTEVCDGLNFLHRNGLVHCNLNPENVMVSANDGHVKLIDIGVPETKQDADRELLIKEMEFVAPEIIKGEDFDSRADIYSLGVALYEMLTGKRPNAGSTVMGMLAKAVKGDPLPDVRTMRPEVSASVAYVLSLMCAPKPENRPVTSRAVADLLVRAAVDGLILPETPAEQPAERRKRKGGWLGRIFKRGAKGQNS